MTHRRSLLVTLLAGALVVGSLAGFLAPRDDDFFALRKNFQILGALYEELVGGYVDPLDAEKLLRTGIEAMLRDLDPYTTFMDEADNADIDIITRGRYGGVGVNLGMRNGKVTVISTVEGASAHRQGVRPGDVITHIGGRPTERLSSGDVRGLMRGEPGTAVALTIFREGVPEALQFLLTREEVRVRNVSFAGFLGPDTTGGVGYIRLERFARDADAEVHRQLQQMLQTGRLDGIVLDLRDNPGGLLEAAVNITQLFVPQGSVIVSTEGRLPQTEHTYRSQSPPLAPDAPLVVLVNKFSASASEIVAGAVQDLDRGLIIGAPTYGKGLVQIIKPLPYNTSLKLTTSRYYTPSGRSIQAVDYRRHDGAASAIPDSLRKTYRTRAGRAVLDGRGIEPDVMLSAGAPGDLEEALDRRAAFFFFANHYAAGHPKLDPDFEIDDAVWNDFRAWLDEQDFSYRTDAERDIEALEAELKANGYVAAEAAVEALKQAVRAEKERDFARRRARLSDRLSAEILTRYEGGREQTRAALARDPAVQEALRALADPAALGRRLRP